MQTKLQQVETQTQAELQRIQNKVTRVEATVSDQVAGAQQASARKSQLAVSCNVRMCTFTCTHADMRALFPGTQLNVSCRVCLSAH